MFDDVYSSERFNMEVLAGPRAFPIFRKGPGNEARGNVLVAIHEQLA